MRICNFLLVFYFMLFSVSNVYSFPDSYDFNQKPTFNAKNNKRNNKNTLVKNNKILSKQVLYKSDIKSIRKSIFLGRSQQTVNKKQAMLISSYFLESDPLNLSKVIKKVSYSNIESKKLEKNIKEKFAEFIRIASSRDFKKSSKTLIKFFKYIDQMGVVSFTSNMLYITNLLNPKFHTKELDQYVLQKRIEHNQILHISDRIFNQGLKAELNKQELKNLVIDIFGVFILELRDKLIKSGMSDYRASFVLKVLVKEIYKFVEDFSYGKYAQALNDLASFNKMCEVRNVGDVAKKYLEYLHKLPGIRKHLAI